MPKGAEFGSDATQLSAPQGAGANPLQGVQTSSYTPNLAPIASMLEQGVSLFDKFKKHEAEDQNNAILKSLAERVDKVDQGFTTGAITPDDASRQKKLIYSEFRRNYPGMVDDFRKQASFDKEFGTSADIMATQESKRKQEDANIAAANSKGIPVSPTDSPAIKKQAIELYQLSVRTQEGIKEARDTAEFLQKEKGWKKADAEAQAKAEQEGLLNTLGASHFGLFASRVNEMISRAGSGGAVPEQDRMALRSYYQQIRGMITPLFQSAPDLAGKYMALFDGAWKDVEDNMKPGGDIKALKDSVERSVLLAKQDFFKKVKGATAMVAMADFFKTHPALGSINFEPVQTFLLNASGVGEDPKSNVPLEQIVGHPDRVEKTLKGLKDMTASKTPEGRQQTLNAASALVDQYHTAFVAGKLGNSERDAMFKTLGSPEMTEFIRNNPLGPRMASQLATIYDKSYVQEFQNNLQNKLYSFINSDNPNRVGLADWILEARGVSPAKHEAIQIKDLITVEHNGVGLTISPVSARKMSAEAVREFEKASKSASNIINIGAALVRKDPKQFWEENKARFLPGMGYPPPPEVAKQNSEDAAALKREQQQPGKTADQKRILQHELDIATGNKNAPIDSQANQGIRNKADIDALEQELKSNPSPMARRLLETELRRLKGQ